MLAIAEGLVQTSWATRLVSNGLMKFVELDEEQIKKQDRGHWTDKGDVYGLGISFYELTTGQNFNRGKQWWWERLAEIKNAVLGTKSKKIVSAVLRRITK